VGACTEPDAAYVGGRTPNLERVPGRTRHARGVTDTDARDSPLPGEGPGPGKAPGHPLASIVVPAHDEAAVVGRLLDGLLRSARAGELAVVVVANGCSDDTAAIARSHPGVDVIETPVASKIAALRLGDAACITFPRLYVDADVEISTEGVRALVAAVHGQVLAAVPRRELVMAGRPWAVRAYYRVWSRLPSVRVGLFGRGVIALSEQGHTRTAALPPVVADDLWLHHAFAPVETRVVQDAVVTVHAPRRTRDLLRRRLRVVSGATEIHAGLVPGARSSRTRPADLISLAREDPGLAPALVVFLAVTLVTRVQASRATRQGRSTVWHRDESSRSTG